jgi:DNA-binding GntR family transcriptional regulator
MTLTTSPLRNKAPEPPPDRTLAAEVRAQLREDLLAGRFRPNERLRMEDLRSRYGVGFTPLREALMHLTSDGLVIAEQQRGFRAAPISLADHWDIATTRQAIEDIALADALTHGDDEWEAEIVSAFHRLTKVHHIDSETGSVSSEWAKRHFAFHAALVSGAKSRWIKRIWKQLYEQSDRYRRIAVTFTKAGRENEHREIMQAALDRDTPRILQLNRAHIKNTASIVAEHISEVLSAEADT